MDRDQYPLPSRCPVGGGWPGVIGAYRPHLPVNPATPIITLHEGGTPLLLAPALSERVNARVYLKIEGANPTGSFKDRGMTMAISKACEAGAQIVVCASTGNTSASLSAYAARAGLTALVLIPEGKIAMGKLAQAIMHGAIVVQISGNFDQALDIVRVLGERPEITVVNSINPYRIEGQKTAAFEVCDVLGDAPTVHMLPVGNAGNITAYWRGYCEYHELGLITRRPRMLGWQAAGAAPFVHGAPVTNPETIATAIRIGNPASWQSAIEARDASGGAIGAVTDDEILAAYHLVARAEGVFVEPSSAASIAGLLQAHDAGSITRDDVIVCTVTGHGLKDPQTALVDATIAPAVPPTADAVLAALDTANPPA